MKIWSTDPLNLTTKNLTLSIYKDHQGVIHNLRMCKKVWECAITCSCDTCNDYYNITAHWFIMKLDRKNNSTLCFTTSLHAKKNYKCLVNLRHSFIDQVIWEHSHCLYSIFLPWLFTPFAFITNFTSMLPSPKNMPFFKVVLP